MSVTASATFPFFFSHAVPPNLESSGTDFAGPMYFWDSFATRSARLEDVLNKDLDNVPSVQHFQNLVSWHPWLGLGGHDGRTYGQAYGNKLPGGFELLPDFLQTAVRKQAPEMLDTDNWTEFRNDFADYMQAYGKKS